MCSHLWCVIKWRIVRIVLGNLRYSSPWLHVKNIVAPSRNHKEEMGSFSRLKLHNSSDKPFNKIYLCLISNVSVMNGIRLLYFNIHTHTHTHSYTVAHANIYTCLCILLYTYKYHCLLSIVNYGRKPQILSIYIYVCVCVCVSVYLNDRWHKYIIYAV